MSSTAADRSNPPWLIVGAPMEGSGTNRGEVRAPDALRRAGLVAKLGATDLGDLPVAITDPERAPGSGVIAFDQLIAASRSLADAVSIALSTGWRPVVLGGCCSVLIGALGGLKRHSGVSRLIFIDGHLDLFDEHTTSTGEVAGMALGVVTGRGAAGLANLEGPRPLIDSADVIAIGDADGPRRLRLHAPGAEEIIPDARVFDATIVRERGAAKLGKYVADLIDAEDLPFWLHLDVDVLDTTVMPAVSFPVTAGLIWEELEVLLTHLGESNQLVGVSVAGFNADLDLQGQYATRLVDCLSRILARR